MSMGMDYDYDFDVREEEEEEEVKIRCALIAETEKAVKVNIGEGMIEWFPKSRCEFTRNTGFRTGVLLVPRWLLNKKGIQYG